MCVNHRRADIPVAEEFLDSSNVIPVFEYIGSKRMPKPVRAWR
jgi:hypothetical protein